MLEVPSSTPLITVQDRGRFGLRKFGIGTSGAMDGLALSVANLLLGNKSDAAAIEVTASPFRMRFLADLAFSLAGADAEAKLNGQPVPPYWTMLAPAGSELVLQPPKRGLRTYVALAGGIALEPVLGSRSTDVKSGFGGLEGRALVAGDRLVVAGVEALGQPSAGFGVTSPDAVLAFPTAKWLTTRLACACFRPHSMSALQTLRATRSGQRLGSFGPIVTVWGCVSRARRSCAWSRTNYHRTTRRDSSPSVRAANHPSERCQHVRRLSENGCSYRTRSVAVRCDPAARCGSPRPAGRQRAADISCPRRALGPVLARRLCSSVSGRGTT